MRLNQTGFEFTEADTELLYNQRAITKAVNDGLIQVGAIYLKSSSKHPVDSDWANKLKGDTNLQDWIDDPELLYNNVGFNLQFGWMDVDIDASSPMYNRAILAAMVNNGIDARFRFGRVSVGYPTHLMLQLGEEESVNFAQLRKFEPKEFRVAGKRYHTQLRSYPTNLEAKNVDKEAKQTVMPGSVYSSKTDPGAYDLSVWYDQNGSVAKGINAVATTTPRRVSFNEVVRAIAFGTVAYLLHTEWVEGSRQITATKVSGWLARVVHDSQAVNNHEAIANEVWCPIDTDDIAESLIHFICEFCNDDEPHMRVRTFRDARDKLARNPDAKIPGWPAMEQLLGGEKLAALRAVLSPGSDVSELTKMAERYVYDETDNTYIDRQRHRKSGRFVHEGAELERRHKGDIVRIGGKPREAFKIFESSDMRKRVDRRDMYPDNEPGGIYRFDTIGNVINDDSEEEGITVFNTWRGWSIPRPDVVDTMVLQEVQQRVDRLLGLMTQDNAEQIDWIKQWLAWTIQHPGKKQQIALVCVGGQGVGKSYFGNVLLKVLFGSLWGSASSKVVDTNFSVEPFIDKMMTFIDEAKFGGEGGVEEIKKLVRNVDVPGAEKFGSSRNYMIYSRLYFASNGYDMKIGQANIVDRALFFVKAYDQAFLHMREAEFRAWAEQLKPWFEEFTALLQDRVFQQHLMEFFATHHCSRAEIESIRLSSSNDAAIVAANMSWSRRVAKHIIESAYVFDEMAIEIPFDTATFALRVEKACREIGIKPMQYERIMAEYEEAGVISMLSSGRRRMYRFDYMVGTLTDKFGEYIGAKLNPAYEYGPGNYGDNDADVNSRIPFMGKRVGVVAEAAAANKF